MAPSGEPRQRRREKRLRAQIVAGHPVPDEQPVWLPPLPVPVSRLAASPERRGLHALTGRQLPQELTAASLVSPPHNLRPLAFPL